MQHPVFSVECRKEEYEIVPVQQQLICSSTELCDGDINDISDTFFKNRRKTYFLLRFMLYFVENS